jgi:hypothetical protein
MKLDEVTRAIISVGDGGRGFVVQGAWPHDRLVITAAHCLPFFPPCMSFSDLHERTYQSLLGPLRGDPTVWTQCLFVDPIGDIAVLGPPDGQELYDECSAYEALMEGIVPLSIAGAPPKDSDHPAWLFSLDGEWFRCTVNGGHGPLWIKDAAKDIVGGMSGSPIVADGGSAIGVHCCSSGTEVGPEPRLVSNLPGWLLRDAKRRNVGQHRKAAASRR